MRMKYLRDYINHCLSDGKYCFAKSDAMLNLNISNSQFAFQAYRIVQKSLIKHLTRDFYMIIPAEFSNMDGVPPHWVIDPLMKHLKQDYYISLLTAASMYGATHQQPMSFQVITNKTRRPIKLSRGVIEFHMFKDCESIRKEQISSNAGYAQISSKEQTMLDLIRFYQSSGYLSNVALVIQDLGENCNETKFVEAIRNEKNNSVLQRLGFICHLTGLTNFANHVLVEIKSRNTQLVVLRPDISFRGGERDHNFRIIINDSIEIE